MNVGTNRMYGSTRILNFRESFPSPLKIRLKFEIINVGIKKSLDQKNYFLVLYYNNYMLRTSNLSQTIFLIFKLSGSISGTKAAWKCNAHKIHRYAPMVF